MITMIKQEQKVRGSATPKPPFVVIVDMTNEFHSIMELTKIYSLQDYKIELYRGDENSSLDNTLVNLMIEKLTMGEGCNSILILRNKFTDEYGVTWKGEYNFYNSHGETKVTTHYI